MVAAVEKERLWARDNVRANLFLLDSAAFYVSARRLLRSNSFGTVMPGLVCAAYAIEQLMNAALEYHGITPPTRGRAGHNLPHLASLLPVQPAIDIQDLELFTSYFDGRYFDNRGSDSMANEDYAKLDDIYHALYMTLDIPLQYHHRVGLLASLSDGPMNRADREIFQLDNTHFDEYLDLRQRSIEH
jgi:hypothetical protein